MSNVIDMADFANALLHQHAETNTVVSGYLNRPKRKAPRFTAGSRVYIPAIDEAGSAISRPEWSNGARKWRHLVRPDIGREPLRFWDDELEPETAGPDAA